MASDAVSRVPNELWVMIKSYVPSISKHVIAAVLGFKPGLEDKHSRLWNSIFQNEKWLSVMVETGLNPVLIGHDLHQIYRTKDIKAKTKSKYLALVLGYNGDGGKYGKPYVSDKMDLLISSLKPHKMLENGERFFPETKITINIRDALYKLHYTTITRPRQLVSRKLGSLYSAYLYWNDDSFKVRKIEPENIVGIERALTKNVSSIVGLTWEHLPEKKLRQHFFQIEGMEDKTDQIDNGGRGPAFKVTGWKWKDE